jgi:hypothetical protein
VRHDAVALFIFSLTEGNWRFQTKACNLPNKQPAETMRVDVFSASEGKFLIDSGYVARGYSYGRWGQRIDKTILYSINFGKRGKMAYCSIELCAGAGGQALGLVKSRFSAL